MQSDRRASGRDVDAAREEPRSWYGPWASTAPSTGVSIGASTAPSLWADTPSTPQRAGQRPRPTPRGVRPIGPHALSPAIPGPVRTVHQPFPGPGFPARSAFRPLPTGPGPANQARRPARLARAADARTPASARLARLARAAPAQTVLALIYAAAIRRQPIPASANTRPPTQPGRPARISHAFSHCENQAEPAHAASNREPPGPPRLGYRG